MSASNEPADLLDTAATGAASVQMLGIARKSKSIHQCVQHREADAETCNMHVFRAISKRTVRGRHPISTTGRQLTFGKQRTGCMLRQAFELTQSTQQRTYESAKEASGGRHQAPENVL